MIKDNFDRYSWQPIKIKDLVELLEFKKEKIGLFIVDRYEEMLEELFLLRNPKYKFNKEYKNDFKEFRKSYSHQGNWFYFPWLNMVIRYLPEVDHLELRTGRNKNLVTKEEQEKFYNSHVAVFGMSVGSHVALTLSMSGGAKSITLADLDIISGSNLNRIRAGFSQVGVAKVKSVARQIYEINPYTEDIIYEEGVTEDNLYKIFNYTLTKKNFFTREI